MPQRTGVFSDGDRIHENKPSAGLDVRNRAAYFCRLYSTSRPCFTPLRPLVLRLLILTPLDNLQHFFFNLRSFFFGLTL